MKDGFYYLLSDGKTVREINNKEYYEMWQRKPKRTLCVVTGSHIYFRRGDENTITLKVAQVEKLFCTQKEAKP